MGKKGYTKYHAAARFTRTATNYLAKRAGAYVGNKVRKWYNSSPTPKRGVPVKSEVGAHHHKRAKYKKVSSHIQGDDVHSGINADSVNIVQRPSGKRKHALANWKFNSIVSQMITSNAGAQNAAVVWSSCRRNQFMVNTAPPVDGIHVQTNLFELNNSRITTGSALFASQTPANDKLFVKEVVVNMMITNMSTCATVIELFFVETKRDTTSEPLTCWSAASATEGLGNIAHVSPAAGIYGVGATVGSEVITDWKNKPNHFKNFTTFYKVKKVKKILLATSASHELTVKIAVNKLVKREQLVTNGNDMIARLSLDCLAVQYGQGVDDATTTSVPTIGQSKVAYVSRLNFHCSVVKGGAFIDDNVISQQIPFAAALVNQKDISSTDVAAGQAQA